jgi:hypothetical protein
MRRLLTIRHPALAIGRLIPIKDLAASDQAGWVTQGS